MFGPNVKASHHGPYMHHREKRFQDLLKELNERCQETFCMPDYEFLFVTGSGTLANEIVISSFRSRWRVLFETEKFGRALSAMNNLHHPKGQTDLLGLRPTAGLAFVRYETSISALQTVATKKKPNELIFADCVSSFPFYSVDGADIFTTVSSKQIGAYPIVGIIGIAKNLRLEAFFRIVPGSCLDLFSYHSAAAANETPHTPAIPLLHNLLDVVRNFHLDDFRARLQARIDRFYSLAAIRELAIGQGPVITLKESEPGVAKLAVKWSLYHSPAGYQIFLWSGTDWQIDDLFTDIKRMQRQKGRH